MGGLDMTKCDICGKTKKQLIEIQGDMVCEECLDKMRENKTEKQAETDWKIFDLHSDFELTINFEEGFNHLNGLPTGKINKHFKEGLTVKQKIATILVLNSLIKEIIFDMD